MNLPRKRRTPKHPRGARLAGAPAQQPAPSHVLAPAPEIAIEPEKPKKRAARKRAPKPEVEDE